MPDIMLDWRPKKYSVFARPRCGNTNLCHPCDGGLNGVRKGDDRCSSTAVKGHQKMMYRGRQAAGTSVATSPRSLSHCLSTVLETTASSILRQAAPSSLSSSLSQIRCHTLGDDRQGSFTLTLCDPVDASSLYNKMAPSFLHALRADMRAMRARGTRHFFATSPTIRGSSWRATRAGCTVRGIRGT